MTAVAVVVAVLLIVIGSHESTLWNSFLANPCKGKINVPAPYQNICEIRLQNVQSAGQYNRIALICGLALGPLFGLILGVNAVARELELGTTRLAWTQSFSRFRWLMIKCAINGVILVVILVPLCLIFEWWNKAAHYSARLSPSGFLISGFLPLVYSLVAFSLVVLLGLYLRRVGWSLVVGTVLIAIVLFAVETYIRPELVSPQFVVTNAAEVTQGSSTGFYSSGGIPSNSWARGSGYAPQGLKATPSTQTLSAYSNKVYKCFNTARGHEPGGQSYCLEHLHADFVGLYVPDSDFWSLQFSEYAIYLGIGLSLTAGSIVRLRRMMA
jgi:hypothetical protein